MLSRERILPVAVSVLVLVASALSVAPPGQVRGGGPEAPATPRIAIAGAQVALPPVDRPGTGGTFGGSLDGPAGAFDGPAGAFDGPAGAVGGLGAVADVSTIEEAAGDSGARRLSAIEAQITAKSGSPLVEDGTLLKPVVVDPTVADGAATIDTYRVRAGDTLTGIARRYGVSMMTLWWANDLKSKDDLHVGQVLRVPPVNGLVWAVKEGQTLAGVAKTTGIEADTIVAFNGLEDETLVAGQTLIIPGARGKSIPIPKPQPVRSGAGRSGTVSAVRPPVRYSGGRFAWPVLGGRISQYFHYGHYGIDIAANYGTSIRSVAAGTVTYAGWRSNGGGYQVWLAHGSGLYTAYYHMAGVSVVRGQSVARGQRIGRIGCSGWCTGPHTHFEVWIGPVMNGGYRVNPLRYL